MIVQPVQVVWLMSNHSRTVVVSEIMGSLRHKVSLVSASNWILYSFSSLLWCHWCLRFSITTTARPDELASEHVAGHHLLQRGFPQRAVRRLHCLCRWLQVLRSGVNEVRNSINPRLSLTKTGSKDDEDDGHNWRVHPSQDDLAAESRSRCCWLWLPYGIGQAITFSSCGFFFLFFS